MRRALALEDARREGRHIPQHSYWPQALLYSDHVRYVEQLRRYHAVFAPEQVLVLIYDDFRADNEATVRRVLRFLGVDETLPVEASRRTRRSACARARLHELDARARSGTRAGLARGARRRSRRSRRERLRRDAARPLSSDAVYGAPPAADEELMGELRRRFKPEVVALSEYLGRDLVGLWGYDGVELSVAGPRRSGRRQRCRTSSSSGIPRAARRRCTRCCESHPQIYMPRDEGAAVLRATDLQPA